MRKTRLSTAVVLGVAAVMTPLAALAGPASAATSSTNPNTPEQVASGINVAHLPGATVFGTTPADTPETVSFILQERNYSLLQANVINGVTKYLSVSQFASTYGQTPANIAALTSYLAGFGIKTDVYADNVDVSATGTAGEFDAALSVTQNQYHVPAIRGAGGLAGLPAQTVHGTAQAPLLPYRLSNFVLAILGLTNYGPYASNTEHVNTSLVKPQLARHERLPESLSACPARATSRRTSPPATGSTACTARAPTGPARPWRSSPWPPLTRARRSTSGSNIAKIPNTGRTFTVQNIDGGPGAPSDASGTGETDLDLEQSGSLAPGANVIDYQAPNTDSGFADSFFTAASQNTADTVSTSWGESETILEAAILAGQEAATYNQAFDEAFLELAIQGQSAFDASGDTGAYSACRDLGTTNLSVQSNSR